MKLFSNHTNKSVKSSAPNFNKEMKRLRGMKLFSNHSKRTAKSKGPNFNKEMKRLRGMKLFQKRNTQSKRVPKTKKVQSKTNTLNLNRDFQQEMKHLKDEKFLVGNYLYNPRNPKTKLKNIHLSKALNASFARNSSRLMAKAKPSLKNKPLGIKI